MELFFTVLAAILIVLFVIAIFGLILFLGVLSFVANLIKGIIRAFTKI